MKPLYNAEGARQTRKLQKSGGSTITVSLPKTWVSRMRLKSGDSVSLDANLNDSLTIYPGSGPADSVRAVVSIGPKDSDESIRRKIVAMYLAGYKSIRVSARGIRLGPGQMNAVHSFARTSMVGTEIVESSTNCITIKILTRLPELTFETAILRMCSMAVEMHHEALEALRERDVSYAEQVVMLDDEIDRFAFYMLRNLTMAVGSASIMREMSLKTPSDCLYYRTAVSSIERIADHAALIAKRVKYLSDDVDPDTMARIKEFSRIVMEAFRTAVESLIRSDYAAAEDVSDRIARIQEMQEGMMRSVGEGTANATVTKFVLDSIRRSSEYTQDITEVVMDLNIDSIIQVEEARLF